MPEKLADNKCDLAIFGNDIAEEYGSKSNLVELLNLKYGYTTLVASIQKEVEIGSLEEFIERVNKVICRTEYPLITQRKIYGNEAYKRKYGNKKPIIKSRFGSIGDNENFIIKVSYGATEASLKDGSANLIVDSSSSGATLIVNKLKKISELLKSSARLYTTEEALTDKWKSDLIYYIKEKLERSINI